MSALCVSFVKLSVESLCRSVAVTISEPKREKRCAECRERGREREREREREMNRECDWGLWDFLGERERERERSFSVKEKKF